MRNFVICTAAVLGMVFVGSMQVEAGNRHGRHHNYGNRNGHGFNRGHSGHRNYNSYSWGFNYNNAHHGAHGLYRSSPVYHNMNNFDYHGPSLQRHGYFVDFAPVHYDVYHTGHHDF